MAVPLLGLSAAEVERMLGGKIPSAVPTCWNRTRLGGVPLVDLLDWQSSIKEVPFREHSLDVFSSIPNRINSLV